MFGEGKFHCQLAVQPLSVNSKMARCNPTLKDKSSQIESGAPSNNDADWPDNLHPDFPATNVANRVLFGSDPQNQSDDNNKASRDDRQ